MVMVGKTAYPPYTSPAEFLHGCRLGVYADANDERVSEKIDLILLGSAF
jgi:hypothetical protein